MPDGAMEVLLPFIQRFQTGNVKALQQPVRHADNAIFDMDGIVSDFPDLL